jgi:hypothetical protein
MDYVVRMTQGILRICANGLAVHKNKLSERELENALNEHGSTDE